MYYNKKKSVTIGQNQLIEKQKKKFPTNRNESATGEKTKEKGT